MGKVLIYILTEGKGGVEEYVMNLSRYNDKPSLKYGYLVMGESTVYEEELNQFGVECFFLPKKNKLIENIKEYKKTFKQLRDRYDTLYFNTSGLYYPIPYLYAIKNKYNIVIHSHSTAGSFPKRLIHYFNRIWVNKYTKNKYACSTSAGKWMFGKRDFELIPNAINIEKFVYDVKKRKECREKYGIKDSFVIGNIGRLHQVKNQVFLVDVLYRIIKNHHDVVLLLVGDGEMKEIIIRKAEELGVLQNVIFTGETNTPEDFYSAMDCFVMPSIVEGFPVALVEAQANGLPCVVSDSITRETNISTHIKYLSLSDSPEIWAKEILSDSHRYNCTEQLQKKGFDVNSLSSIIWENLQAII